MLAKANRITSADDYRVVVRRGAKVATPHTVSYVRSRHSVGDADGEARFGFIVSKKVGSAVRRNRIRRRLKAVSREALLAGACDVDVVVRALPGAADASWPELRSEVIQALVRRNVITGLEPDAQSASGSSSMPSSKTVHDA
ncbi:ribonuclease P protein component [Agromyces sp. PvR057]|uniref:ribonuclease P protein component n=1 Tax=Agromyces sp. PvR057 TaxID=3156403 RepID=UPI000E258914